MNKKVKAVISIAVFALLLISAGIGYRVLSAKNTPSSSSSAQSSKISAPDFTVQDSNGKNVKFSDLKGNPIVLNFWASWCSPCKNEMPDYEKMYKQYSKKGVKFLMVNLTDGDRETVDTAKQFLKENDYTFPAYFDVNQSAADAYNITAIPDSIFINRKGTAVGSYKGMIDEDTMKANIESILK